MSHPELQSIIATLKRILKNRGLTYRQLAVPLEMSESGVKKLLNGADVSLGRLLQICDVLSVPLSEVIHAAGEVTPHTVQIPAEQEDFFVDNVAYYYFLATLVQHQYDRRALQEVTGLSDASAGRYLTRLSEMGFFPLEEGAPDARVSSAFITEALKGTGVSMRVGSRLGRQLRRELSHRLLDTAEDLKCNGSDVYDAHTLKRIVEPFLQRRLTLTVDSVEELRQSLGELLRTFSSRSRREQTTAAEADLVHIGWSYVIAPFDGAYPLPELRP